MAKVRHWLTSVEVDHTLRLEPLLRSIFFCLMSPEQLATHLDNEAAYFYALATKYRELTEAKDRGDYGQSAQTQSLRIAVEAGTRLNQALSEWAEWAKTTPLAHPGKAKT